MAGTIRASVCVLRERGSLKRVHSLVLPKVCTKTANGGASLLAKALNKAGIHGEEIAESKALRKAMRLTGFKAEQRGETRFRYSRGCGSRD